ncbi:hypothetical protein M5K25_001466 [Dendrobium thyrsiflorum]|uniref:Uncharacterized protein n=1 Tax=Dendrobium thyrsiflorum TaxID=117978 RepID=A0ABD0VQK2_DENTH
MVKLEMGSPQERTQVSSRSATGSTPKPPKMISTASGNIQLNQEYYTWLLVDQNLAFVLYSTISLTFLLYVTVQQNVARITEERQKLRDLRVRQELLLEKLVVDDRRDVEKGVPHSQKNALGRHFREKNTKPSIDKKRYRDPNKLDRRHFPAPTELELAPRTGAGGVGVVRRIWFVLPQRADGGGGWKFSRVRTSLDQPNS